jgi:predicted ATPase/class 3 adenylate cyclase
MSRDVENWLRSIGLQQYSECFIANAIDLSVVSELTEEDLRELEIPLGHRRKLLRAIRDLELAPQMSPAEPTRTAALEAERRQISVMFCDLVGSTDISGRLDPEDMRALIMKLHECVSSHVARHGGTVAQYLGDGALVYFGYPLAHEDDCVQAVQTGLDLVEAVPKIRSGFDFDLAVRIGIATGPVVIGDILRTAGGGREKSVIGETPNLAARLQSAAKPGSVAVCANTRQLTEGYFDFGDLGALTLKGWPDPVAAWEPLRPTGVRNRFEARSASKRMRLLGREEEIEFIMRRWKSAVEGSGRAVVLSGESGIGKSHIAAEVSSRIGANSRLTLTYACSPHHVNSALYPFIDDLERSARFQRSDTQEQKIWKLSALVEEQLPHVENALPLLTRLLSLPVESKHQLPALTPQQEKEATLDLLSDRLITLARNQPVLTVFEDAHWADPTSLDLLARLVDRLQNHSILLLITTRPEFTPSLPNEAHVSALQLTRLGRQQGQEIVEGVLGGKKLPEEVLNQILARTDGVPLFIEELTKSIVESGQLQEFGDHYVLGRPLPALTIPATLQASLMARLDHLAAAREVAQVGAVIGREFSFELVNAVAEMSTKVVEEALRQVGASGLLLQRGTVPQAIYSFKHALVRETAYSGLLKSRRAQLHAALARVLETQFREVVDGQPEILAHHYSEAGLKENAVRYWLQAGRKAAGRSANMESVAHLQSALQALEELAPSPARDQIELDILMTLGPAYIAIQGPAGRDASSVFSRARAVCERLGDVPEYLQVLFWITTGSVMRGELPVAKESIAELLERARLRDDQPALLNATRGTAMILMFMGELRAANDMIDRAFGAFLESDEEARIAARAAGQDAGVADLALMSWILWLSGKPDTAAERIHDSLARAEAISHPHSEAYACYYASVLHALLDDTDKARVCADRCVVLSDAHGFRQWHSLARTIGDILSSLSEGSTSLEPIKAALHQYRSAGYQLGVTAIYVLLCQSLLHHREYESAIEVLRDAFTKVTSNSERIFEAELCRLHAMALLGRNGGKIADDVESLLTRALETARAQGARALELRAACDIAELSIRQNQAERAYATLAPLCASFSDVADTSDLRRARSILRGLDLRTCGRLTSGS